MDIYSEESLKQFIEQNPLNFSARRIELAKKDFYGVRNGKVSDEYADYILWALGEPSRHERFGKYLLHFIKENGWKSILEVGCGEETLLAQWLYQHLEGDVSITAMDICEMHCNEPEIRLVRKAFDKNEDLSGYDVVVAQEPCDATESVISACTEQNIPFCVILCGVAHTRLTGELDEDAYDWYAYLMKTYPGCGFQLWKNGRFSSGCIYSEKVFYKLKQGEN